MSRSAEEEMSAEASRASREALSSFAAASLDWPAVRELILPFAPSPLGVRALQELAPRSDDEAESALVRAREMQAELESGSEPPLAGSTDPVPVMERAVRYRRTLAGEDLAAVATLLRRIEELAHWLAARRDRIPRCDELWAGRSDLSGLREALDRTVDAQGRVRDDASEALRGMRREIEGLARQIEARTRDVASDPGLRAAFADGDAGRVHRRGGRFVLAVRVRHAGRIRGIVHDRSQSGETVFVEPQELVESGNRLAALRADEEREVNRVLADRTRDVLHKRDAIERDAHRLAELELAVTSARFAARYDGHVARLPGEPGAADGLYLRSWRHPLLVAEVEAGRLPDVVPIDLRLGEDFDMLVITGPNTGGKTLALKGGGLAVLMTRLGFALPCEAGTTVPLYEGIVADIGDEQEIQQNLSTFSSHLARIRDGLQRAGKRTLFLLDELGGGTDPAEGAALGDALLQHLLDHGVPTLASTHLGKLKEFAFRNRRVENAHVEFDIESLAPRYRLIIGAPGESRALAIARRLGLPDELLAAADGRLERTDGEVEHLMGEMRALRVETERLRGEAAGRVVDLEREAEELAGERAEVDRRRSHLEAEAQRGLEERISRAGEWLERGRRLLSRIPASHRGEVEEVLAGLDCALSDAALTDRRRDFLRSLKKGDHVWLPKFKKRCVVTRIWRDREELGVRLGKHDMKVAFDDVTFYESL